MPQYHQLISGVCVVKEYRKHDTTDHYRGRRLDTHHQLVAYIRDEIITDAYIEYSLPDHFTETIKSYYSWLRSKLNSLIKTQEFFKTNGTLSLAIMTKVESSMPNRRHLKVRLHRYLRDRVTHWRYKATESRNSFQPNVSPLGMNLGDHGAHPTVGGSRTAPLMTEYVLLPMLSEARAKKEIIYRLTHFKCCSLHNIFRSHSASLAISNRSSVM